MGNLYVYGIIEDEELELTVDGVGGADRAYTVDYRNLSAVVSDIDTTDPEQTDEAVTRHNEVLQSILEHDGGRSVVPMQFGMAFNDARTLKSVLRGAMRAFRTALNEIDGAVELGLKLVAAGSDRPDPERVRAEVAEIVDDIAVNQTDDDLFSDRLILNRSYLVERGRRAEFDDAVDEIEARFPEVTVQYTGPWPPYNFVDIEIGAEGR